MHECMHAWMDGWRALGACGASAGSPPGDSPPFTEQPQRHHCTQAGGGRGVWLLPRQGWKLLGEVLGPRAAQARCAKRHAPRNPGTRRGGSTLPPPPTAAAARASRQSRLQSRGAPRRPNGQQGSLSPTGLRCLVPGSTALLGPSVTSAFLGDARQAHLNLHRSGRGEMAPAAAAAPGGGVSARTQAQKASLGPRAPGGRAGPPLPRGAEHPVAWEIRDASPLAPPPDASCSTLAAFEHFWGVGVLYRFDTAKCFAAFVW